MYLNKKVKKGFLKNMENPKKIRALLRARLPFSP